MNHRKMIGEIMVSLGYVSLEQINEARRNQMENSSKRIGEYLIELGYISHEQVSRALALQNIE